MAKRFCRPLCVMILAMAFMLGLVTALDTTLAWAHRVNIFAWVEGDTVHVQAGFSRKSPARQSAVTVFRGGATDANDVLLTGVTDDAGTFAFAIPAAAREHGLTVRVNAGQGHQNDWTMDAKEFAAATNGEQTAQTDLTGPGNGRTQPGPHAQPYLADDGPRLRDIIGGLGWIVGLTGMGMAWRARRRHG